MSLVRSFPILALTLTLLSILGLSIAQENIEQLLVAGTLVCISWFITEGPRGRALPAWVSRVLIIGLTLHVFVQVARMPGPQPLIDEMGYFALWLSVIKLYERKTPRDYSQLIVLCLLMMLSGCMRSASLVYGVVMFGTMLVGVFVVLLHQVYSGYETSRRERKDAHPEGYRFHLPVKPSVGRNGVMQFRGLASAVIAMGLLLSILIFAVFPRNLGQSLIQHLASSSTRRVTGYDDTVDLFAGDRISTSRRMVGTMRVSNEVGMPVLLRRPLYLRGAILEQYAGNDRWISLDRSWRGLSLRESRLTPLRDQVETDLPGLTLALDFNEPTTTLFYPWTPIAFSSEEIGRIRIVPSTHTLLSDPNAPLSRYKVRVVKDPPFSLVEALFSSGFRARRPRPYENPRVEELARRLLAGAGVPAAPENKAGRLDWNHEVVQVLMKYLRSGRFTYTLDLSDEGEFSWPPDQRPLDLTERFLLHTRRGHCEYFAAGLVALCQSVGVPARLVSGYYVTRYDENLRQYIILQSDAHAWTEILTGRSRWESFDPTPTEALEGIHDSEGTLADQLRWAYQRVESDWQEGVVGYDEVLQSNLANSFLSRWRSRAKALWLDFTGWMDRVNRAFYFGPTGYIWMGFVGSILIIAVVALVKMMRRSRAIGRVAHLEHIRGSEHRRMLHHLGFYVDMLAVLERAKLPKPFWLPPRLYAHSQLDNEPEISSRVGEITDLFYRARYSGRGPNLAELSQAQALVTELAGALGVKS